MKKDKKIGEGDEVYKFYKRFCWKIRLTKERCDYLTKISTKIGLLPTTID